MFPSTRTISSKLRSFPLMFQNNRHMSVTHIDAFSMLGLCHNCSIDEAKNAYKSLVKRWHPDLNKENVEDATERFKQISDAYDTVVKAISLSRSLPSFEATSSGMRRVKSKDPFGSSASSFTTASSSKPAPIQVQFEHIEERVLTHSDGSQVRQTVRRITLSNGVSITRCKEID